MVPIRVNIIMEDGKQAKAIGGIPIIMGSNYNGTERSYQELAYIVVGISHLCLSKASS